MDEIDVSGWTAPDGTPLEYDQVVTMARGEKGMALRYTIEITDKACGYVLGDCLVGGHKIEYGGQVVKNSIPVFLKVSTYRCPKTSGALKRLPNPNGDTATTEASSSSSTAAAVGVAIDVTDENHALLSGCEGCGKQCPVTGKAGKCPHGLETKNKPAKGWMEWLFGC